MKKQTSNKLRLDRETLAPLTGDALRAIHGGAVSDLERTQYLCPSRGPLPCVPPPRWLVGTK